MERRSEFEIGSPAEEPDPSLPQKRAQDASGRAKKRPFWVWLRESFGPLELYLIFSAWLVLSNARLFYSSMHMATEQASFWYDESAFDEATRQTLPKVWSAPLDDVFIHFDFARATARGYPFEWTSGNGYSSGGTSLLYPFVLAAGYLFGYRGLSLELWAGVVAAVSVFSFLLAARRLFSQVSPYLALFAPPLLLSTGVLSWSLWSGMEVALFLAIWGLCLVLLLHAQEGLKSENPHLKRRALALGMGLFLLVGTRPEAAFLAAWFGAFLVYPLLIDAYQRRSWASLGRAALPLLLAGGPPALLFSGHLVANFLLTGDSAAAGALAKLEMHHPYLEAQQVWDAWLFHVAYQIRRLSEYHLSGIPFFGYAIWPLALLSLFFRRVQAMGLLLWLSIITWILVVALNGQVRWQNERYAMPALAFLLLAAALGVAGLVDWVLRQSEGRVRRLLWLAPAFGLLLSFLASQGLRIREQVWFFGRACRNILEQHVRAGHFLRHRRTPVPRHVLVSDAGAIPYMSDVGAFDLIGLGGYGHFPIAKASRQGVGAAVELIEHIPRPARPDVMALYPSWWGNFVLWFGRPEREFPVRGNVICGGASKVIYEPDFGPIDHSGEPLQLDPGERIIDELDFADVISERAHEFKMSRRARGYVDMKMLSDPRRPDHDLWDAGRLIAGDVDFSFELQGFEEARPALLLRVAPTESAELELELPKGEKVLISLTPSDHWQEVRAPLPVLPSHSRMTLRARRGDVQLYHLFAVDRP